jgi:hypothetical protein
VYAAGLAGRAFGAGERTPTVRDVALAFAAAARADSAGARARDRALGRLAAGYLARLHEEYAPVLARLGVVAGPAHAAGPSAKEARAEGGQPLQRASGLPVSGRVGVGAARSDGVLTPGGGLLTVFVAGGGQIPAEGAYPPRWTADTGGVALSSSIVASPSRHLALSATARRDDSGFDVADLQAVAAWRRLGAWAGRRSPGYGTGAVGGATLTGSARYDGAGLFLAEPVTLPGLLRHAGPWRLELFGSRLDSSAAVRHPWFLGGRVSIAPHHRLQLGMNRGAFIGGEGNLPITPRRLLGSLFLGFQKGESQFENQVLSFDGRFTPTLAGLPLDLSLEWGMEDGAGAVRSVPGIVAGLGVPAVPGLAWLSVGVERATFAQSCCFNPPWGRHAIFQGGWTNDGRLAGHPLGGEGRETSLLARADLLDARLRVAGTAFRRTRGIENLLAPVRQGASTGGTLRLEWRTSPLFEIASFLSADVGRTPTRPDAPGQRWRDVTGSGSLRVLF